MKPTRQHTVNSITIKHVRVRTSLSPTADDKVAGNHDSAAAALITAWRKIKKLAKSNTTLFLGLLTTAVTIMTALAAVITYVLNFFVFCIDYGYYSIRFNVPVGILAQPQAASLSLNAVLGITLLLLLFAMNSLGVWAYRNCRSIRLLLAVSSVVFTLLLFPFMDLIIADFSWPLAVAAIIVAIFFSIIITLALNIALICTFTAPTTRDKLLRNQAILSKWKRKKNCGNKRMADKINKLETEIHSLEQNLAQRAHSTSPSKKHGIATATACLVFLSVVILVSCVFVGTHIMNRNEIITLAGQEQILQDFADVLPEKCEANTLAVLYQGDDFLLVAPCMANDDTVVVYSSFQRILSSEGTILIYRTNQLVYVQ